MDICLVPDKSRCKETQKIIVSQDNKSSRKHIAHNDGGFRVRHYRLDGDLVKQEKCCDFLLLNDSNLFYWPRLGERRSVPFKWVSHTFDAVTMTNVSGRPLCSAVIDETFAEK